MRRRWGASVCAAVSLMAAASADEFMEVLAEAEAA